MYRLKSGQSSIQGDGRGRQSGGLALRNKRWLQKRNWKSQGMEMLWAVTKPLGPQVSDIPDLEIVSLTTTEDS